MLENRDGVNHDSAEHVPPPSLVTFNLIFHQFTDNSQQSPPRRLVILTLRSYMIKTMLDYIT